ncbi:MAG: PIN domain-containing protein [Planctomycetota bacterium]|nr:PIN domain-containing protein [Planctomycetota bacterium]
MKLFVDTSVWSLAVRRDTPEARPEVDGLRRALEDGDLVFTTGLVLQELLQGLRGPKAAQMIVERFATLPLVTPGRDDHIEAAGLRNDCRRRGMQITTIDALLAQLCIRHELVMLTTDADFARIAKVRPLEVWGA